MEIGISRGYGFYLEFIHEDLKWEEDLTCYIPLYDENLKCITSVKEVDEKWIRTFEDVLYECVTRSKRTHNFESLIRTLLDKMNEKDRKDLIEDLYNTYGESRNNRTT